jgi:hypothetical protein
MTERRIDQMPAGGIVSQGDGAVINANNYTINISVQQRAELLAEVGRALRPVLGQMQHRIAQLEHDNRLLRDTLASRAELPPRPCPQEASRRDHHAPPTLAALDVGSDLRQPPPVDPWEPATLQSAPSYHKGLLEELRRG